MSDDFKYFSVQNYAEKVKISSKLVTRVTKLPFLVDERHLAFQVCTEGVWPNILKQNHLKLLFADPRCYHDSDSKRAGGSGDTLVGVAVGRPGRYSGPGSHHLLPVQGNIWNKKQCWGNISLILLISVRIFQETAPSGWA